MIFVLMNKKQIFVFNILEHFLECFVCNMSCHTTKFCFELINILSYLAEYLIIQTTLKEKLIWEKSKNQTG